jgi:hypothetical protein
MIWYDMIYDMIWYMIYMIWYDMIYDTIWYMIWYMIWYDKIWYLLQLVFLPVALVDKLVQKLETAIYERRKNTKQCKNTEYTKWKTKLKEYLKTYVRNLRFVLRIFFWNCNSICAPYVTKSSVISVDHMLWPWMLYTFVCTVEKIS